MAKMKTLTSVEHILVRPNLWIGSVSPSEKETWVLNEDDTISFKKISYTEGLLKICNEAIDNSVDVGIKTNWEKSTKIDITITKDTFTCEDNGTGIPVEKNESGEWIPVIATCVPMSGTNFEEDRNSIGANGVGIKAANIFSKKFECVTCDGKGKLKIVCTDNLSTKKVSELKPTAKTGTIVSFSPDFDRFGVKEFRAELMTMIKTRLKFLSWFYPKCQFTFNGQKIGIKAKDIASMFPQPAVVLNEPNVYICIYPSEEPYNLTYVNGLYMRRGGTQIDYILNKVITDIREKVSKKYKAIKPADIKNRLGIVCFFKGFPNCEFDSQTKETLTNSVGDITSYFQREQVDLDKFTAKILKQKEIIDNITEMFRLKEELAEKKELAKLSKVKKEIDSEKYYPPIGKTAKKYLMITEGFSAFSGMSPILGRKEIGYYMLKGKILNVLGEKPATFMANQEINDLVNILGIDIANPDTPMTYDKVVILTDADADGNAIAGLVLTLFNRIAPNIIKQGRVCRLETPLLIGSKGEKIEEYYFTLPDKSKMKKNLEYFYLKGLGSWTKNRFNQILEYEGGLEKLMVSYTLDDKTDESINKWFGKESDGRKDALRGKEFHIDNNLGL